MAVCQVLQVAALRARCLGRKRDEPKALEAAKRIDAAVDKIIAEAKHLTPDLGGTASTTKMGDAIAAAV